MKVRYKPLGNYGAVWLFLLFVVLAGVFTGDARSFASGEGQGPLGSPSEEPTPVCDAQVQSYVEDFSSYAYKAYTQDANWNVSDQRLTVMPMSAGAHREPSIAPDSHGGAYIAWSDLRNNNSNGNWDIYAQYVDERGNRLWTADLRVNSDAGERYQGIPAIAVDSQGNAIVVWLDDREDAQAVYAQRISAQGAKLWPTDIQVNGAPSQRTGSGLDTMAIAIDAYDNVVVIWQGNWDGSPDPDVYAQKINSDGQRLWANDVRVNEDVGRDQLFMAVDVNAQGYVVVAWVDDRNGGQDIYAQRLDPEGNRTWPLDVKASADTAVPHQGNPDVVLDSQGNAVVVWRRGPEEPPIDWDISTIYAQKVDADGHLLWAGDVQVNQDTTHAFRGRPRAARAPGGDVLVIWEDDREGYGNNDLFAQRLSSAGARRWSTDMSISPREWWGLWKSRIRTRGNRAYVTWSAWGDVYIQLLDLESESLLLPIPARVNEADGKAEQHHADVSVLSGGRALVAWHDFRRGTWDIRAQAIDLNGQMVWPNSFQVSDLDETTNQWRPRIATNAHDKSLIVWNDDRGGIYGQLVDSAGNRLWTVDKRINADGRWCLHPTVAAMPGNAFVVAWVGLRDSTSDLWDVFIQRVDEGGDRSWESDRRVNSGNYHLSEINARSRPEVTVDAQGHMVVVWRGDTGEAVDVYVRRLSPDGAADWGQDLPLDSHIGTAPGHDHEVTYAVVADDRITVAWGSYRDGRYGIYAQRLDLGGGALWGPGVWVSSATDEVYYGNPDLALAQDGDVIVTWADERNWHNVYGQRLSSAGHFLWLDEIRLNDFGAWSLHPSLSMETEGSFIAVWHDERYGDESIYARRFDADGALLWSSDLSLIPTESYYYPEGVAESSTVDDTANDILRASLGTSQTLNGGTVTYYLSNDGGQTWEETVPGELHTFTNAGSDLRWRAILSASEDRHRSPIIQDLSIRYGPDLIGDAYEMDDDCACAQFISPDGTIQRHTFHDQADIDWVTFDATSGHIYLIEAQVPADSSADVTLELYDQCGGLARASQDHSFSPGVRLEFQALADGPLYLKLLNHAATYGPEVAYHLSVRAADDVPSPGALVLVAGRGKLWDPVQDNIHHVADQVYGLFLNHDYDYDRITYLATDPGREGVDGLPTRAALQEALTIWALDKVGPDRPFTLYMVDHGGYDRFDLDKPSEEWVTPQEIDNWLSHLEQAVPGVKVNVVIDACLSGSFIDLPQKVSRPGRVVIASTGAHKPAWPSDEGAVFSDYFLAALGQKESLYASFQSARWATQSAHPGQTPWLDDDGDGIANEAEDGQEAARRGFAYDGTLQDAWPPYVVQAIGPTEIGSGRGVIQAEIRDDVRVRRVWAVIYPPSYQPPAPSEEMTWEILPTIVLVDQGEDWYAATYTGFDEVGTYRVVVYAEDDDGLEARPLVIEIRAGYSVWLPLMIKGGNGVPLNWGKPMPENRPGEHLYR